MMTSESLLITCPAKVNLALGVDPPDKDGMHPIASWMVAITFGDSLRLRERSGDTSAFDIAFDAAAPIAATVDWPLEKDLAFRAHAALEAECGQPLPVEAVLRKRVPPGRGLGGGSSDAAGMLTGLRRLFELNVSDARLLEIAGQLGSDVVFLTAAMLGSPSAVVSGLGECIDPMPLWGAVHLVLIFPPLMCPTGAVYKSFDALAAAHGRAGADWERASELAIQTPLPAEAPYNDLAAAAFAVEPELERYRDRAADALAMPVHVTGSGSALFAVVPDDRAATRAAERVTEACGLAACATRSL